MSYSSFADVFAPTQSAFGLGPTTSSTTSSVGDLAVSTVQAGKSNAAATDAKDAKDAKAAGKTSSGNTDLLAMQEGSVLTKGATRDISRPVDAIVQKLEAERLAAEKAAREAEEAAIAAAQAAKSVADTSILPDVDFTCGKAAFVEEWGARIDAYLAGSPLGGYGSVFAEAAFDNGVDPRWSPAISCTESGKGSACFRAYNAWGWGAALGSNWEDSIRMHVAGLAAGYGYTISMAAAQKYCPPNSVNWYNTTLSQMALM